VIRPVCFILLVTALSARAAEPSPEKILSAVRQTVPSATTAVPDSDAAKFFAGEFSMSPEVDRRAGAGYGGDRLYLLPDHTYYLTFWNHIPIPGSPISDQGKWSYDGKYLRLEDDHTRKRHWKHDDVFVPLFAKIAGAQQLCLLGIGRDFHELTNGTKPGDDDFSFLLYTRVRLAPITDAVASRAKLMKEEQKAIAPRANK
jgi:hypothetical protein